MIFEFKEQDFLNLKTANNILLEIVGNMISPRIQQFYKSKKNRQLTLEKYGEKAFLDPDNLKFPVVDPKTGELNSGLLYAARIRAKQFSGRKTGYRDIAQRAEEIYRTKELDNDAPKVRFEGHTEAYEVIQLLDILEVDFSELEEAEKCPTGPHW